MEHNALDGQSLDIRRERLALLREHFPNLFSEGELDLEKLRATFCDEPHVFKNERYTLNWAGKGAAYGELQKRVSSTLRPQPELSVNFETSENVFIEGENLEVLKILQKSYFGKIKCIIIDPPYNTGSDAFIYPDNYKERRKDYKERAGLIDEEGYLMKEDLWRANSRDGGQFHSNWLSMMLPRLFVAHSLLSDDGVIFVHIDDNEVHNLRLLMDEVFGEENFVGQLVWQRAFSPKNDAKYISNSHDYIIIYAKNLDCFSIGRLNRTKEANERYNNPDNDPRGVWTSGDLSVKTYDPDYDYPITTPSGRIVHPPSGGCWRLPKETFIEKVLENRIWFGMDGDNVPRIKRFLSDLKKEGMTPTSILFHKDVGHNQEGSQEVSTLMSSGVFEDPKPIRLLFHLLTLANISNNNGDIILDFFAGSGTTGHAVLEFNKKYGGNRRFILVQLPEKCKEGGKAHKANYKTIADITRERLRRAIQKIEGEQRAEAERGGMFRDGEQAAVQDLGFKSFVLSPSNFRQWRSQDDGKPDAESLLGQMEQSIDPLKADSQTSNVLHELMLKTGCLLTDKIVEKGAYHCINGGELVLALSEMNQSIVDAIIAEAPQKVIALDRLFAGNDELKTNAAMQMKDAGIDFKTV